MRHGIQIRTDYRNILQIFSAYNDSNLSDSEKVYVCLRRLFTDFDKIPSKHYEQAYAAATAFIDCGTREDTPAPKTINWDKDEQLIFPPSIKQQEWKSVLYPTCIGGRSSATTSP